MNKDHPLYQDHLSLLEAGWKHHNDAMYTRWSGSDFQAVELSVANQGYWQAVQNAASFMEGGKRRVHGYFGPLATTALAAVLAATIDNWGN